MRVIIESPLSGEVERNIGYAKRCMTDSILRGEAPFASHLLYAQNFILDDAVPSDRELGMTLGFEWAQVADKTVVYSDYGITEGMKLGILDAEEKGRPVEYRKIL